jgi:hypothetical protein
MSTSAFGVDHGEISKATWAEKREKGKKTKQNVGLQASAGATGGLLGAAAPGISAGNRMGGEFNREARKAGYAVSKPKGALMRTAGAVGGGVGQVRGRPIMAGAMAGAGALGAGGSAYSHNKKRGLK